MNIPLYPQKKYIPCLYIYIMYSFFYGIVLGMYIYIWKKHVYGHSHRTSDRTQPQRPLPRDCCGTGEPCPAPWTNASRPGGESSDTNGIPTWMDPIPKKGGSRVIYYYNAGKMMLYKGKSIYTRMIYGYPYFRKSPYFWASDNNSLTWNLRPAIGMIPHIKTMIPGFGRTVRSL